MSTCGDHRGLIFSSLPHSSPLFSPFLAFLLFILICHPVLRRHIAVGKSCHSMSLLQPCNCILCFRKMFSLASHTSVLQTTGIRQKDTGFAINVFTWDFHCRFFKNQYYTIQQIVSKSLGMQQMAGNVVMRTSIGSVQD